MQLKLNLGKKKKVETKTNKKLVNWLNERIQFQLLVESGP